MLLHQAAGAQEFSEKRTFSKSVKVNRDATLEVSNKYGTIHILSWNNDSVSIRAEVEAFAANQSRLGKMLEGIEININETDYLIRANTEFSQSINMLFESFKGMTNKIIPYDSRIQINYFISMPEYIALRVDNKYGDVYMEKNTNNIGVTLSNGSLKATYIKKASELNLTFCDATINNIGEATIDASFSEIYAGSAESLMINSISSRYDLKDCGRISTDSKRDKFFIGTIGSIQGTSYFTDFRIEKLNEELNITIKYGSISAEMTGKSLRDILVNSSYSDVSLTFDPSLSYYLDIRHTNAYLSVPQKNASLEKKTISDEKREYITSGNVGKGNTGVKVRIEAARGNIFIR
jgi:hypothetical protein